MARPVGACGRHSGVQPGYRDYVAHRGRLYHAVSGSDEPHTRVPISKNRRGALCRFCVRGLDRSAAVKLAQSGNVVVDLVAHHAFGGCC
jgi:hypothetical protein